MDKLRVVVDFREDCLFKSMSSRETSTRTGVNQQKPTYISEGVDSEKLNYGESVEDWDEKTELVAWFDVRSAREGACVDRDLVGFAFKPPSVQFTREEVLSGTDIVKFTDIAPTRIVRLNDNIVVALSSKDVNFTVCADVDVDVSPPMTDTFEPYKNYVIQFTIKT